MNREAEDWAVELGLELGHYMASGDFGEAYETECGMVIKITSDKLEYVCADKMIGKKNDFAVNIYNTKVLESGYMAILQEKLETCPEEYCLESLFYELIEEAERQGTEIHLLDEDEFPEDFSKDAIKMSNDIWKAVSEYLSSGTNPCDIHAENIGVKSNGSFGLFDQQDKRLNPEYEFGEHERLKFLEIKREEIIKKREGQEIKENINSVEHVY